MFPLLLLQQKIHEELWAKVDGKEMEGRASPPTTIGKYLSQWGPENKDNVHALLRQASVKAESPEDKLDGST